MRDSRACSCGRYSPENTVVGMDSAGLAVLSLYHNKRGEKSTLAKENEFKQTLLPDPTGFLVASFHRGLLCLPEIASPHVPVDSSAPVTVCAVNVT